MIVITTPTGQIGRQTLDRVLDGGEAVRVIARDPARLPARVRERAEVVPGSHDDPAVVAEAFTGADRVLWVVPPNFRAGVEDYYLDFTRPACEAIEKHGVSRVVAVSSLGRAFGPGAGHLSAAFAMDDLIESTGVHYRALRMPFFMENLLDQVEAIRTQGAFFLATAADRPLPAVATRDIAAVAAGLLLDDSWTGQDDVPVIGSTDLTPDDMARVMAEVLGRPVRFQQVALEDYRTTMLNHGASEAVAQGLVDMAVAHNQGVYDAEAQSPTSPTGFRQWCEDVLKPAVLG